MNDQEYGKLLHSCIDGFLRGESSLGRLTGDVESIVESISDERIQDRISEAWWTLEQVYSVELLHREMPELPPSAVAQVESAIRDLSLIASELSRTADSEE